MGNSSLIDIIYLMLLLVFSAGNIICNFSMFLLEQNKNPLLCTTCANDETSQYLFTFENVTRVLNKIWRKKNKQHFYDSNIIKRAHIEFKIQEIFPSRFANLINNRVLMHSFVYWICKSLMCFKLRVRLNIPLRASRYGCLINQIMNVNALLYYVT